MTNHLTVSATSSGFTLAELLVVLFILTLSLVVVFPMMVGVRGGDLGQASRELIGTAQFLFQEAIATKRVYRLEYNFAQREYWVTAASGGGAFLPVRSTLTPRRTLPSTVEFQDIWTLRGGKRSDGTTATEFHPLGRVERTTIHLRSAGGGTKTLIIHPLTGRVRVEEGYADLQE